MGEDISARGNLDSIAEHLVDSDVTHRGIDGDFAICRGRAPVNTTSRIGVGRKTIHMNPDSSGQLIKFSSTKPLLQRLHCSADRRCAAQMRRHFAEGESKQCSRTQAHERHA